MSQTRAVGFTESTPDVARVLRGEPDRRFATDQVAQAADRDHRLTLQHLGILHREGVADRVEVHARSHRWRWGAEPNSEAVKRIDLIAAAVA